jgi:hypothetical protein
MSLKKKMKRAGKRIVSKEYLRIKKKVGVARSLKD